jgi:hypothetical protein
MDLVQHFIYDRAQRNADKIVSKLVDYLAKHEAHFTNKLEQTTGRLPDSLLYYTMRLDEYYLYTVDMPPQRFKDIEDHFQNIIKFLFYDDQEYAITLVSGITEIPPHIAVNLTIPDTFYETDQKDFPEFPKHSSRTLRIQSNTL